MKVRGVIRMLRTGGWLPDRTKGSHRQFVHPTKRGVVTVSGGEGLEMPKGTLASALRQAGLRGKED